VLRGCIYEKCKGKSQDKWQKWKLASKGVQEGGYMERGGKESPMCQRKETVNIVKAGCGL